MELVFVISFVDDDCELYTWFMKKNSKKFHGLSFKLDKYFFRNLVIALAVVLFWRGMWGLMDVFLFPDNEVLSYGASILAGFIGFYLVDGDLHHLGNVSSTDKKSRN